MASEEPAPGATYDADTVAQKLGMLLSTLHSVTKSFSHYLNSSCNLEHGSWYTDKDIAILAQIDRYIKNGLSYERIRFLLGAPSKYINPVTEPQKDVSGDQEPVNVQIEILTLEALEWDTSPNNMNIPAELPTIPIEGLDIEVEIVEE